MIKLFLLLSLVCSISISVASSVPVLAFSYPKPFPGLESGFSKSKGSIIFLPSFHPCGTLQIISVKGLLYSDFKLLSTSIDSGSKSTGGSEKIKNYFNFSEDKVLESDEEEEGIVNWSKGWKRTCGKGDENREVRFARLDSVFNKNQLEGTSERELGVIELDRQISVHLSSLPAVPHNHVVILTTLSNSAALSLFDIVSSSPPPNKEGLIDVNLIGVPHRTSITGKNSGSKLLSSLFWFVFKVGILLSLVYFGAKWWRKRQLLKRGGAHMLPLNSDDELLDEADESDEYE